jgi:hypothetical protein
MQHPSIRKSRHYFADSGGRSVGIVRMRTKATEFSFSLVNILEEGSKKNKYSAVTTYLIYLMMTLY